MDRVTKTDIEWKKELTKEQFIVLRKKGTEIPFSGKYVEFNELGDYVCAACSNVLFNSDTKFDSFCGWPSFYDVKKNAVEFKEDNNFNMKRIEVLCKKCGGHLGHVFDDGPKPTRQRYCINSVALNFRGKNR